MVKRAVPCSEFSFDSDVAIEDSVTKDTGSTSTEEKDSISLTVEGFPYPQRTTLKTPSCITFQKNSVKKLLDTEADGKLIIASYGKKTTFSRHKLAQLIVKQELKYNADERISSKRFVELANEIKQIFLCEEPELYYVPYMSERRTKKLSGHQFNKKRLIKEKEQEQLKGSSLKFVEITDQHKQSSETSLSMPSCSSTTNEESNVLAAEQNIESAALDVEVPSSNKEKCKESLWHLMAAAGATEKDYAVQKQQFSDDGILVSDDAIVEVKCFASLSEKTAKNMKDILLSLKGSKDKTKKKSYSGLCLKLVDDDQKIQLKRNHNYYYQSENVSSLKLFEDLNSLLYSYLQVIIPPQRLEQHKKDSLGSFRFTDYVILLFILGMTLISVVMVLAAKKYELSRENYLAKRIMHFTSKNALRHQMRLGRLRQAILEYFLMHVGVISSLYSRLLGKTNLDGVKSIQW
ncbi:hypothetical protein RN001_005696 [Aquatica leii]|uniref:Uncharacterized protein n=1 Tax=Aquatica leii TaxID=1421715 RepID=A0AAN7SI06_9COLE|nr:hypothetical protein RN001_005696 [Aquatica leii]